MLFSSILGLPHIKNHLTTSADNGRVPHAQLFVGKDGSGTLATAIAYAQYLLCKNTQGENTTGNEACNLKVNKFAHPDLHFVYPTANNKKITKNNCAEDFTEEWRNFLASNIYPTLYDWYNFLGIENKQGVINVRDAQNISKTLSLKSYEGGYKIMVIWHADKLNNQAANKILKLIEEPPNQTVFLLVTESEDQILDTIKSRCQMIHFPPLSTKDISQELMNRGVDESSAKKIAHKSDGDFCKAYHYLSQDSDDSQFEQWFVFWVRSAFKAKGNKSSINDLIAWSDEISKTGRETQKQFLLYCLHFFRQSMLLNYGAKDLVFMEPETEGFRLENFAPFVHQNNIMEITEELEKSIYHIVRNGNSKIILTDLSIKLTRLLHRKV
ncbi:DNA polymerase III subunit delta' [Mesonia sp. K7]|uniref:DNA polymerase III subunit n=1 Tax=Mesonia sp. K7 TaxID=2218606 RepID=UPI000DAA3CF6|nr:DNA polymerase III subunit delta' [Mesonia sp. K7]PZD79125.1 DNA polymerase III subunit delta' [Mesonia sp. K7]